MGTLIVPTPTDAMGEPLITEIDGICHGLLVVVVLRICAPGVAEMSDFGDTRKLVSLNNLLSTGRGRQATLFVLATVDDGVHKFGSMVVQFSG